MSGNLIDASSRLILTLLMSVPLAASASAGDLVPLRGNVHRLASVQFSAGEAPNSLPMSLDIVFTKTAEQEQSLQQLLSAQQDPTSPKYHRWLAPAEFGQRFGASDATLAAVSNWLKAKGFSMGQLVPARGHLAFFGSKVQVEAALQTRIGLFTVRGERHYANVSDPMIPIALQPMIAAIRGLNDFQPRPTGRRARAPAPAPDTFYSGSGQFPGYVGPTDFAIMYNLLPQYQQGITGAGVTVAIAAQSDLDPTVLTRFWSAFGVAGASFGLPAQQFSSISVPSAEGGVDPGRTADNAEDEAYLDSEIIGGLAPGAHLLLVRDKNATLAAQYVIDHNLAAILSISFSKCESDLTASGNIAVNAMYEQAVAEGITAIVSSGDSGVAACVASVDVGKSNDVNSNGFAVNGLASTPFDLAVGGTDFDPINEAPYWSSTNTPGTRASAQSHISENVWNESCANPEYTELYGPNDPCNAAMLGNQSNPFVEILGSGGGVSSCTTMDGNGNCLSGYAKPSWQQNLGNFNARLIPDVVAIATRWLVCSYDTTPCDPSQAPIFPPAAPGKIKVFEGTSAAAPAVAAIIALLDQTQVTPAQTDGRQGLLNPLLYNLGVMEYRNPIVASECNASQGSITSSLCVFNAITNGSNAQPCKVANYAANSAQSLPASTCVSISSGPIGIMEINSQPQYGVFDGFGFASGMGSINATALIDAVLGIAVPDGLSASVSGQTVTLTWDADASATQGYNIYESDTTGKLLPTPVQQNVNGTSTTITGLQFGRVYFFAIAAVSSIGMSPQSGVVGITTVPASPTGLQVTSSGAGSLTLNWTASSGANSYSVFQGTSLGGEGATPVVISIPGPPAVISFLTDGQQYFFTVTAADDGGSSASSAEANGTVVPSIPSGFAATPGNGSVSLGWAAVQGASSYNIYMGSQSNAEGAQPQQTAGTPSATIAGLTNGTTYYFTVAAVDAGGVSAPSSQVSATPSAPPPPPSKGGGGAIDWLALEGLAALMVQRSRRIGFLI